MNYRTIIYAGTLLTGMTGLIYQVVWQKYLSFTVGSEARSVALVVAVFLCGLAAGFRFWGRATERATSRREPSRLTRIWPIRSAATSNVGRAKKWRGKRAPRLGVQVGCRLN